MQSPNQSSSDNRHLQRFPLAVDAQIRSGSTRTMVRVLNISVSGVRIQAARSLREGDIFWLKLPVIEAREIRVAWVNQFVVGCEFLQPLHPSVLENIVRSAR